MRWDEMRHHLYDEHCDAADTRYSTHRFRFRSGFRSRSGACKLLKKIQAHNGGEELTKNNKKKNKKPNWWPSTRADGTLLIRTISAYAFCQADPLGWEESARRARVPGKERQGVAVQTRLGWNNNSEKDTLSGRYRRKQFKILLWF